MQTNLADLVKDTREGKEADAILRTCVHCGFCLASCPTYQLLDDELDSPRGRIYLMKEVLEGQVATQKTQLHLDRCLTCRACETACPSGVRYGRLIDICRNVVEKQVERSVKTKVIRYTLRQILPNLNVFMVFLKIGQAVKSLLPKEIRGLIPSKSRNSGIWPPARHKRKMLVLDGCVQPSIAPNINTATARILDKIGISLIKAEKENC
ncbi:MAG: 4Fe-4S dicluster domain-containing protein, partial [Nitrosomonadaceae bacterium]|nr:4Fe-4S dicluster domain-containing protein [Nitrosomonadaceae bacterium]